MLVESREETLQLKTYVLGPEDPYPPFQRRGYWSIYPYSLMDDLGEEARVLPYRAFVLENEYLRVTVLPELGGHLYSAVDKATGEELFYCNHVVKPGLIALRGAWVSGGIEFNFPRGHSVTSLSPVDGRPTREDDGSAVIWVGDVEQVHRMAWAVGIRLRPGSSLIETEVRLANRTSLPHPYYFWANAAVPARDDMQFIYPATKARTWQGLVSWPIHEGRDLSRYGAFRFSSDSFMLDSLEDFFGVYYQRRDFGLVHVANVHECFGKKYFTWGTAEGGRIWASALSDEDGPYCEIQSGRFVDQGTWRLMPPHHTEQWTEYWYPVKGIGGFAWANREAAVRICRREGRVECGVMVTRPLPGALVRVAAGDRVLHEQRADPAPDRPLRLGVSAGRDWPDAPLTLGLLDGGGREIIRYTENQPPRTLKPRDTPPVGQVPKLPQADAESAGQLPHPPQAESVSAMLRKALRAEEANDPEQARAIYEHILGSDAECAAALTASGRLAIRLDPEKALARLSQAAALAPESAEAAYYLGIALRRAGRDEEAEVELWRAAQGPAFAHAARVELGLIAMTRGDWCAAAAMLGKSLTYEPDDLRARCLLAASLRRAGRVKEAMAQVTAAHKGAPLDRLAAAEAHFCLWALGRHGLARRSLRDLHAMVPAQADPWLELSFDYAGAGLVEEAVSLLEWSAKRSPAVRSHPLVHYALACWLQRAGEQEQAAAHRHQAARLPPQLVFPHHWELEAILSDALAHDPADAAAHYYRGALLYAQGRREAGLAEWEAAAGHTLSPELSSVLLRNLALARREVRKDLASAADALRRAVAPNPVHPRPYLELDSVLEALKTDPRERLAVLDSAPPQAQRRGLVAAHQIAACLAAGEWDRAVELLGSRTFHRWEAEFRMRSLYLAALVGRGAARFDCGDLRGAREDFERALEYPPNLRIGKPAQTEDAWPLYCAGVACEALGDMAAAKEHWEAAAAEIYRRHTHTGGLDLRIYQALSLRKLGRSQEAEELLAQELKAAQERASSSPEDAAAHLALGLALKASGREEEAGAALQRSLDINPWQPRVKRLLSAPVIL